MNIPGQYCNTGQGARVARLCTGLRMSELFALKWSDVNFETRELDVRRSVVKQIVGSCKTEASQKPVPLDRRLADMLLVWKSTTEYNKPEDWVFASPVRHGRRPYWGQAIMRNVIQPRAREAGVALGIRVARLSPHIFHSVARQPCRREGDAGTPPPRIESGHVGNLHAGDHGSEARGTEQCRQPYISEREQLVCLRIGFFQAIEVAEVVRFFSRFRGYFVPGLCLEIKGKT
jgi:hypothetical protein